MVVRLAAPGVALAAVLLLGGCGDDGAGAPVAQDPPPTEPAPDEPAPDELGEASGRPCPRALPEAEGPAADRAAAELPVLPEVGRAWVCRYDPAEAEGGADDAAYGWRRAGRAEPVPEGDLPSLVEALDGLALLDVDTSERICTADLGPRWLVVLADEGDLTGVVVDDFGCHDTRLTDDPHSRAAGEDGVLQGGTGVLEALGVGRGA